MNFKNPFIFLTVATIANIAVNLSTQVAWAVSSQSSQQGSNGLPGLPPIVSINEAKSSETDPDLNGISSPPIIKAALVNRATAQQPSPLAASTPQAAPLAGMLKPITANKLPASSNPGVPPIVKGSGLAVEPFLSPNAGPPVVKGEMPADEPIEVPFPRTKVTEEAFSIPSHSSAGVPFFNSSTSSPKLATELMQSYSEASTGGQNIQDPIILDPPDLMQENSGVADVPSSQLPSQSMLYEGDEFVQDYGFDSGYGAGVPTSSNLGEDYFGNGGFDSMEGYFGAMGAARFYAEIDTMYMNRNRGSMVMSNFGGTGNYDWNFGWQGTIGTRFDALSGQEISYMGTSDIANSVTRVDPAGRLSALFASSALFGALADPFFDAELQQERIQTRMHSLEFNRVKWGWDVMKMFVGFRYINMADEYSLLSQSGADVGTFRLRTNNDLFGVHIGEELFYDVGYRLSMSGGLKLGIYGNSNRIRTNAISNGTEFINSQSRNGTFSTTVDANLTFHYQINRRARLRAGYEALMLDRVVTAADNTPGFLSPFTGTGNGNRDTVLYHGFAAGLEFYR